MRKLRSAASLLFLFFLVHGSVSAQNDIRLGVINGTLYLRDGRPAGYAEVRLEGNSTGTNLSTTTDDQGRFAFPGLLAGKIYTLTVEIHGYLPIRRSIDLSMRHDYESLTLQPDPAYQTSDLVPKGVNPVVDARLAQLPDAAKKEFDAGQNAMNAKNLAGAISHFQNAVNLYPRYAEAYQLLGLAQFQSNLGLQAEESLRKAVEIEEKLANAQYLLGITSALLGHTELAEKPLQRFVELEPANPDGHFELAKVAFALNKFPDSEARARKAIELKEANPGVHMVLAYALLRQMKAADAKAEFRTFLKLDPNGPAAPDVKNTIAMIEQHEKK